MKDILKAIDNILNEMAPANSTGPAISGLTPDTVFLKKKKRKKRKRLVRR